MGSGRGFQIVQTFALSMRSTCNKHKYLIKRAFREKILEEFQRMQGLATACIPKSLLLPKSLLKKSMLPFTLCEFLMMASLHLVH